MNVEKILTLFDNRQLDPNGLLMCPYCKHTKFIEKLIISTSVSYKDNKGTINKEKYGEEVYSIECEQCESPIPYGYTRMQ